MKRKIIPVLIGCTLSFSALAAQPTAERYVVSFPEGTHVNYAGAFASAFPNGLPVGIGSGLLFTGNSSFPSRHCCRHLNNRLALMPFSRASFEMDIPGSQEAATSSCLNSGG